MVTKLERGSASIKKDAVTRAEAGGCRCARFFELHLITAGVNFPRLIAEVEGHQESSPVVSFRRQFFS
jgi:hypothetical protein